MTSGCRARPPVLQSTSMAPSRLRRAGTLLLVLWLTADVAAFGFCSGDSLGLAGQSTISIIHDADGTGSSPCTGHHCFCCSSGAEVMTVVVECHQDAVIMTPSREPAAADIPTSNTSPPPRL